MLRDTTTLFILTELELQPYSSEKYAAQQVETKIRQGATAP